MKSVKSITNLTRFLADQSELESQLSQDYKEASIKSEDEVVNNLRENFKAFFCFVRQRQNTKARVGPFLDPETNQQNPNPDFSAETLRQQYDSVFSQPWPEWMVPDIQTHFNC